MCRLVVSCQFKPVGRQLPPASRRPAKCLISHWQLLKPECLVQASGVPGPWSLPAFLGPRSQVPVPSRRPSLAARRPQLIDPLSPRSVDSNTTRVRSTYYYGVLALKMRAVETGTTQVRRPRPPGPSQDHTPLPSLCFHPHTSLPIPRRTYIELRTVHTTHSVQTYIFQFPPKLHTLATVRRCGSVEFRQNNPNFAPRRWASCWLHSPSETITGPRMVPGPEHAHTSSCTGILS